jgi:hypothetical protein
VVFFNYGVDTGTVWKSGPFHEPILWRHVTWARHSPDREVKEQPPYGWLFYRRVKTGKAFHRPMNRAVHAHLQNIMPENPRPDGPVFLGGGARPNARFQALCALAGIRPKRDVETGKEEPWELKNLRKSCATYHDENVPESSVEILGHSWASGPARGADAACTPPRSVPERPRGRAAVPDTAGGSLRHAPPRRP